MPDLTISSLPLASQGYPESLLVIVNYDPILTGRTESIYFSALTKQFFTYSTTGITTSETLNWNFSYYGVSASTNVNLFLPDTLGKDGYFLTIKDEAGNCQTNTITLTPGVGYFIDGQSSVTMNINYMSLTLIVRDNNWYLI
jgi:hypothetical protein